MFTNDTNILIYSFDEGVPAKHAIAKRIMQRHAQLFYPVPLQSLTEFYRSTTSKWLLTHQQATDFVTRIVSTFHVETATTDDALAAMWLHDRHRVQFFDALLLMTAKRAGCTLLFSEDLQDKRDYGGVTVRNPFVMDEAELNALLG